MLQSRENARQGWSRPLAGLLLLLCSMLLCSFNGRQPSSADANSPELRYGFALDNALIPTEEIVQVMDSQTAAALALQQPSAIDVETLAEHNFDLANADKGAFLASADRVLGIVIDGQARAYSLKMLARHQLVNDELSGASILVSYCPFSDAAAVYERRLNGEIAEFSHSGLIYNSNMLMYIEADNAPVSLWSQLQGRAISGPEAGDRLAMLPCQLVSWCVWLERYPDTQVCWPAGEFDYSVDPYADQFREIAYSYPVNPHALQQEQAELPWPVLPMLPRDSLLTARERIVALDNGSGWTVFALTELRKELGAGSSLTTGGVTFELAAEHSEHATDCVFVTVQPGRPVRLVYAWWFAWYGMFPDSRIFSL